MGKEGKYYGTEIFFFGFNNQIVENFLMSKVDTIESANGQNSRFLRTIILNIMDDLHL